MPLTEVRAALAAVRDQLVELVFEGTSYWLSPGTAALLDDGLAGQRSVLALPGFDEFLLGYADRSRVLPPRHAEEIVPGGNGMFKKTIVAGGEVVGTWGGPGTAPALYPNRLTRSTDCGLQPGSPSGCRPQSTAGSLVPGRPRDSRWRC